MALNADFKINNTTIQMPDGKRYGPGREADLRKAMKEHHQGEKLFKEFVDRGAIKLQGQQPEPKAGQPVVKNAETNETESESTEQASEPEETDQDEKESVETGEKFDAEKQSADSPEAFPDGEPKESWKKKELQYYMDHHGIDYASNDKKAELLAKIEHFQETQ